MSERVTHWDMLTRLRERYPKAFPDGRLVPVKIGIHHDLQHTGDFAPEDLQRFLRWYTRRPSYKSQLKPGTVRVDLDGNKAGEVTEQQAVNTNTKRGSAKRAPAKQPEHQSDIPLTEENIVPARLELTLKFNELPKTVQVQGGYKFGLDCDGRRVSVTLKPKMWTKLTDAAASYPQWVASVTGKMGPSEGKGFVLLEPAVQVFEKKPKEAADISPKPASVPPPSGRPKLSLKSKP